MSIEHTMKKHPILAEIIRNASKPVDMDLAARIMAKVRQRGSLGPPATAPVVSVTTPPFLPLTTLVPVPAATSRWAPVMQVLTGMFPSIAWMVFKRMMSKYLWSWWSSVSQKDEIERAGLIREALQQIPPQLQVYVCQYGREVQERDARVQVVALSAKRQLLEAEELGRQIEMMSVEDVGRAMDHLETRIRRIMEKQGENFEAFALAIMKLQEAERELQEAQKDLEDSNQHLKEVKDQVQTNTAEVQEFVKKTEELSAL
jgi:hypothetical protein